MAEWSIAAVLKTVELQGSGGSNPSLSAEQESKNRQNPEFQTNSGFFILRQSAKKGVLEQLKPAKSVTLEKMTNSTPVWILSECG